jgi:hypothetical protein
MKLVKETCVPFQWRPLLQLKLQKIGFFIKTLMSRAASQNREVCLCNCLKLQKRTVFVGHVNQAYSQRVDTIDF